MADHLDATLKISEEINTVQEKERDQSMLKKSGAFFNYLYQRSKEDRLVVNAGYLSFISLLSLVPLVTVIFTMITSFSKSVAAKSAVQHFIVDNFLPASSEKIVDLLNQFIENTAQMSALGGVFLFITAMLLISAIDKCLNYIWRVKDHRRWITSFSVYWMILTLGPFLIGTSIALSSSIQSSWIMQSALFSSFYQHGLKSLPFLLSMLAFVLIFLLVPNRSVRFSHALIGALVTTILFELGKYGFVIYVHYIPSYQIIYGTLSIIPIFFIWIQFCWMTILIGAEITAALSDWLHLFEQGELRS